MRLREGGGLEEPAAVLDPATASSVGVLSLQKVNGPTLTSVTRSAGNVAGRFKFNAVVVFAVSLVSQFRYSRIGVRQDV